MARLEREAVSAADAHDAQALDRLMAEDFVITFQPEGGQAYTFSDKRRTIAHWTRVEPGTQALPTLIDPIRAQVDGDTGIVFARVTDRWRDAAGEHQAVTWVSDVWMRHDGRWQWFAAHESPMDPGSSK